MNNRLLTPEETSRLDSIVSEMSEGERLTLDVLKAMEAYRDAKERLRRHLTRTKTAMQVMTECYDSLDKTD